MFDLDLRPSIGSKSASEANLKSRGRRYRGSNPFLKSKFHPKIRASTIRVRKVPEIREGGATSPAKSSTPLRGEDERDDEVVLFRPPRAIDETRW